MNINFSNIIKNLIAIVVIVSIAYLINCLLYFLLPKNGIEIDKKDKINLEYRKFNIEKSFKEQKTIEMQKSIIKVQKQEYKFLSNVSLKAVYYMAEQKGWIILEDKSAKTYILSVGEKFKEYILTRIYLNYVVFVKNNIEYKIELNDSQKVSFSTIKKDVQSKKTNDPRDDEKIIVLDDKVSVQRAYLNSYINNFDKIWKEIHISEVKINGKINGFKVNRIGARGVFEKLGLRKNDIIKSVNNIELKSYSDAFKLYKKINKITDLNMKILRNGKEMELDYEIE